MTRSRRPILAPRAALKRAALTLAAIVTIAPAAPARAGGLELGFPVACTLGVDCFIQNYVDLDPSPGVRDVQCGAATYDGHKGTDIRLLSTGHTRPGVAVLAAAPGIVKAVRDGIADRLIGGDVRAPAGLECGNGLVIDHGGGWETQYCHLLRGSIAKSKGDRIDRGARLGLVGYSGKAAFAHLHLSVRRNGAVIDPFIGTNAPQPCPASSASPAPGRGLWMAGAVPPPAGPLLIEAGFVDQPIGTRQAETRSAAPIPLTATSPALVFFARYINLRPGDTIRLTISGPAGFRVENTSAPLERPKAQYIAFAGKKLKAARWPPGRYQAEVTLMRASRPAPARTYRLDLR